jgi:hypothetical protein
MEGYMKVQMGGHSLLLGHVFARAMGAWYCRFVASSETAILFELSRETLF